MEDLFEFESVNRMDRDLVKAASIMSDDEARYLVDAYYTMQDNRKRSENQARTAQKANEPNLVIQWYAQQNRTLEDQVKRALDGYTIGHKMGSWMREVKGIGPVISAGLLAHINIEECPTAGHIWNFAGLNPKLVWPSTEKAAAWVKENGLDVPKAAEAFGRNPTRLYHAATHDKDGKEVKLTAKGLTFALSRRPYNASLKTLCWKIGQSFMKFSNHEDCYYGQVYKTRKMLEVSRNESGGNAELAAEALRRIGKDTEAHAWLTACYKPEAVRTLRDSGVVLTPGELTKIRGEPGSGVPMLPPGQIDARARRYAVKLFLSHMHDEWYRRHFGKEPPMPYPIAILGHAHYIAPPNRAPAART